MITSHLHHTNPDNHQLNQLAIIQLVKPHALISHKSTPAEKELQWPGQHTY
jgi:hypothetical protein